jgi:hypothetical protein
MLALAAELTQAQEPEPGGETLPQSEADVAVIAPGAIAIQGRLTDDDGNPINGSRSIRFRLYTASSGGTVLCSDTHTTVSVKDGLFSSYIDDCQDDLYGQKVWLGVKVGSDAEMTPRQPIYPVPYALTLRPGAVISDTSDGILTVRSTGSGDSDALVAYAGGSGEAVEAHATDGVGLFASSENYIALQAYSVETQDHPGVFGCSANSYTTCDPYRDDNAAGVMGYSQSDWGVMGIGGSNNNDGGVYGKTYSISGYGGLFYNTAGGQALQARSDGIAANSNIVSFKTSSSAIAFKVQGDGDTYADGSFMGGGADFAEMLSAQDGLEPGDVLIIGPDGDLTQSAEAYQASVAGVYSTQPGFVGGGSDEDDLTGKVPLAVVGVVPAKASAENGAIHPGDLLVTATTPGHAMRAGDNPPQGTVLGKALGELVEGTGVIQVLVTLQ